MTTRLPSNLRPTTRECVHLVTRGHLWSRDKFAGHTIRSAISKNPCYMQTSWIYVLLNWSYVRSNFYIVGIRFFRLFCSCDLDLHPMTFSASDSLSDIWRFISFYCIVLYCIALHCIALYCIALHCIALYCIALHCIAYTNLTRIPWICKYELPTSRLLKVICCSLYGATSTVTSPHLMLINDVIVTSS